jgi:hypothetical protein
MARNFFAKRSKEKTPLRDIPPIITAFAAFGLDR